MICIETGEINDSDLSHRAKRLLFLLALIAKNLSSYEERKSEFKEIISSADRLVGDLDFLTLEQKKADALSKKFQQSADCYKYEAELEIQKMNAWNRRFENVKPYIYKVLVEEGAVKSSDQITDDFPSHMMDRLKEYYHESPSYNHWYVDMRLIEEKMSRDRQQKI